MYATIGAKKGTKEHPTRFWLSVSENVKKGDNEERVQASIACSLSKDAIDAFFENAQDTKNDDVKVLFCDIKEYWLKPAWTKDGDNFVKVFVNKIGILAKKAEKKKW